MTNSRWDWSGNEGSQEPIPPVTWRRPASTAIETCRSYRSPFTGTHAPALLPVRTMAQCQQLSPNTLRDAVLALPSRVHGPC